MLYYVQELKNIFFKKNYDFDRPDVNLYNFHPQLQILLAINGIFFNKKNSLLRFIVPSIGIGASVTGVVMETMFVIHYLSVEDYSLATECFCYDVVVGVIPLVYLCVLSSANKIYGILDKINDDFIAVCSMGPRYRRPFLEGHLQIWQLCLGWFAFVVFVGSLYVLFPIVSLCYQSLFATQDEHLTRPLQFPMWLPYDDPYRTPNYEIFLVIQSFLCICLLQTFCVYVYTLFHILLHYDIIMNTIILSFEVVFDGLDSGVARMPRYDQRRIETQLILNKRVGKIVNMHISVFEAVKTISSLYGPPLVYQVMFSSIALCLTAYQIAEKLHNGTVDVLFILLGIATTIQLWIPCYLGTMIRNKAFDVGDACWNCGWHLTPLGLLIRCDVIIIILRAQQPVTIKFTGLPNVQLETFSTLMSKSYSYFNMLRQYS